jgi:hypothetical protein
LKGRGQAEELDIDWRVLLKGVLKKYSPILWSRFVWFRRGSCEHGNEPTCSIKTRQAFTGGGNIKFQRQTLHDGDTRVLHNSNQQNVKVEIIDTVVSCSRITFGD